MEDTYVCAMCGETCEKGLTDEEALEQLNDEFPGWEPEDCDLVCDDCYNQMMIAQPFPFST